MLFLTKMNALVFQIVYEETFMTLPENFISSVKHNKTGFLSLKLNYDDTINCFICIDHDLFFRETKEYFDELIENAFSVQYKAKK